MLGVPTIRVCSEDFWGASAPVFISEMESLGIRALRKWKSFKIGSKLEISPRYLPIYLIITMYSNNPYILAPFPSQWRHAS